MCGIIRKIDVLWVLLLSVCAVTVCLLAGGTIAYFTDTDAVENAFSVGNVDIVLSEPSFDADQAPAVPNEETAKDPYVANNGSEEAIVFLSVQVPVEEVTMVNDDGTKGDVAVTEIYWLKRNDTPADTFASTFYDTSNGKNWVQLSHTPGEAGGYATYLFGYRKALAPASTPITNENDPAQVATLDQYTERLFDKIQLKNIVEGTSLGGKTIIVQAYGVQAEYIADGSSEKLTESLFPGGVLDTNTVLDADALSKIYSVYASQLG